MNFDTFSQPEAVIRAKRAKTGMFTKASAEEENLAFCRKTRIKSIAGVELKSSDSRKYKNAKDMAVRTAVKKILNRIIRVIREKIPESGTCLTV
jgi:hypothetical protein